MIYMFYNNTSLTSLDGLEDWDVSNVTTFNYMFGSNYSLNDASAITDWDIPTTTSFYRMFSSTSVHPEFSKVSGTWSGGTFTPTP